MQLSSNFREQNTLPLNLDQSASGKKYSKLTQSFGSVKSHTVLN